MTSTYLESKIMRMRATIMAPEVSGRSGIRVCMLSYGFYEDDPRISQYATALSQRAEIVDVIALRRDVTLPAFEVLNGVNVYRIQMRPTYEPWLLLRAASILRFMLRAMYLLQRRQKPHPYDIVHIHSLPDFLVFAGFFTKLRDTQLVLDIHDLMPESYATKFKITHRNPFFKLMLPIERASAWFANHVILANHICRDRYIERSSSAEKCSVIRNLPESTAFNRNRSHGKAEGRPFHLIYQGVLSWDQGIDVAIRAFARGQDRMSDCEFHIHGEGPAKRSLIALTKQLGQQGRVLFHNSGTGQEVTRIMALADLAVEPDSTGSQVSDETSSTRILEFMALGVPVLACRNRSRANRFDDSLVQYYENDDEAGFTEQMVRLRNDRTMRLRLIENADRYVVQKSWCTRRHEYLELVFSLVERHRISSERCALG